MASRARVQKSPGTKHDLLNILVSGQSRENKNKNTQVSTSKINPPRSHPYPSTLYEISTRGPRLSIP
jgi:hypothetical protein